jgi:hypothetical protein
MAGPKPFQSAVTPSFAISLLAQSTKPLYVPCGADWSRDLMVWKRRQRGFSAVELFESACIQTTHVRRNGQSPHRNAGGTARGHDSRK